MSVNNKSFKNQGNNYSPLYSNESNRDKLVHKTPGNETGDENGQSPDVSTLSLSITQIINSTRKKRATPDYGRISHHRTCKVNSISRFQRLLKMEPPKGPFFISFKEQEKPIIVETDFYDENCSNTFFEQAFSKQRCIGKGSFGEVFKAFSKDDKRWYAVKITVEPFRSQLDRMKKLREVQKHELLPKHPNLISYVRAWEELGYLYIQTELCQCSLLDYKMKVEVIKEKDLWRFFGDMALAVRYLHSHGLLHLDIKPQNVMVSFDGICKLGDFSLIFDIEKDFKVEDEGDAKYLAPEVLQFGADKPSDIFSLGMTMIDICTDLELPNSGKLWHGFRYNDIYPEYIRDVPPALLDAIMPLLETDPTQRPTAEEICCSITIAKCINERRREYLARNMWWILLTISYTCLFASSWIVQRARTVQMRAVTYLKRIHSHPRRFQSNHRVFKATCEDSPMFKFDPIPQIRDCARLQLKLNDDDEDYNYDDYGNNSEGDKMETSQSEDDELHLSGASVNEELHRDEAEASSLMDIDTPSSSSMENRKIEQLDNLSDSAGGDADEIVNMAQYKTGLNKFGAVGDVFERNCYTELRRKGSEKNLEKKNQFEQYNHELQDLFACDAVNIDDGDLPSTSGSIIERPKTPEPPPSDQSSPLHEGYVTPPSNAIPSPFVCRTPVRGGDDDSPEQERRRSFWLRTMLATPCGKSRTAVIATSPGTYDEEHPSTSEQKSRITNQSIDDTSRRRAHLNSYESAPPAKRPQMEYDDLFSSDDQESERSTNVEKGMN